MPTGEYDVDRIREHWLLSLSMTYEQFRQRLLAVDYQSTFYRKPIETWIFTDEAGTHSSNRFFGIGSLFVWHRTLSGGNFGPALGELCKSQNWSDEFKWSKLSRGNVHRYRKFVEYFFASPKTVQFHCILIDRSLLKRGDHTSWNTLFSFYYLLLAHRIKPTALWRSSRRVLLIPDKMELPDKYWSKLFYSVNASLKRRFGVKHYPLVDCLPTDSRVCLEIQLADVLLGGIVAHNNGRFQSEHKQLFAEDLWSKLSRCDHTKATIWNWQP